MKKLIANLLLLLLLPALLLAESIETFYGVLDVHEPVLLELIESPAMQRLKRIHQYGVGYYTTHTEDYNRFDHSLGVFAILRKAGRPLDEQIAGLLHDVSHTVFSHVGDWIFKVDDKESDYQNSIHAEFLENSGIETILNRHGFEGRYLLPKREWFPALEGPLPGLCADRIDYNIQGAYHRGVITQSEAIMLFEGLEFSGFEWTVNSPELMERVGRFSLQMTQDCWGGPVNHVLSEWLADAIRVALEIGDLSMEAIHHGFDDEVWKLLIRNEDARIQENMHSILEGQHGIEIVRQEDADHVVYTKFRGINPLLRLDEGVVSLCQWSSDYSQFFEATREQCLRGWPVRVRPVALGELSAHVDECDQIRQ